MTQQRTLTPPPRQPVTENSAADPGGDSPLMEQVNAWAQVAERARRNIEQGENAEQELLRRRNGPGE